MASEAEEAREEEETKMSEAEKPPTPLMSASTTNPFPATPMEKPCQMLAELFDDFMKFGSVGLHIVRNDGIILWANQSAMDLLGYTEAEYIGMNIRQVHADHDLLEGLLTTLLAGNRVENVVAPVKHKDGHLEYVEINSSMRQEQGRCVTTRCFSVCVTDRVLREREQQAALERERQAAAAAEETRRKTEFLRKLCHELRNPLGGVTGNLDLLVHELEAAVEGADDKENALLQQRLATALQYAQSAQLAAEYLMNDTLSLSRLQEAEGSASHQLELFTPEVVCVEEVLDSLRAILGVQAQERGIQVHFHNAVETRIRTISSKWLKQILLNVLGNAIKFSHNGGRIDMTIQIITANATQEGGGEEEGSTRLQVTVQDSGIGMSEEQQDRLFGGFCQANDFISAQFEGSGLGLHIVKSLLDRVGGTIAATSKESVGSTFTLELPCEIVDETEENSSGGDRPMVQEVQVSPTLKAPKTLKPHHHHHSQEKPPPAPIPPPKCLSKNVRVLVVDDLYINRKMLASYLHRAGYHNHALAENGRVALELHEQEPFDIILTDVDMPVMDGHEMTRTLRRQERQGSYHGRPVPIIGISGNILPEDFESGKEVGMNEYLGKPYKFGDLEELMLKYLNGNSSLSTPLLAAEQ